MSDQAAIDVGALYVEVVQKIETMDRELSAVRALQSLRGLLHTITKVRDSLSDLIPLIERCADLEDQLGFVGDGGTC